MAITSCEQGLIPGNISVEGTVGTLTYVGLQTACEIRVGMASYYKYDEIIDNQIIYDYRVVDHIFQPHQPLILTITIPQCATQVDLFYGEVIQPTFGNQRYGPRLISALHLIGEGYCSRP